MARRHISVTVNGAPRDADVEPRQLLVFFIRETLGLTGTNVGCDTSTCGSCTVLVDGRSVKSCTMLAVQADGRAVTTIEGMADGGRGPGPSFRTAGGSCICGGPTFRRGFHSTLRCACCRMCRI